MLKKNRAVFVFVTVVFFMVLCWSLAGATDKQALDFSVKNLKDGTIFKIADKRGKIILLSFGSIYCKPCIELLPVLNKLYENNKSEDVSVVGIDIDKTTEEELVKKFAKDKNIIFPFFIDTNDVARQCKVFVLPTIIIIDRSGIEAKRFLGVQPYTDLDKEIKKLELKSSEVSK
jgi:thiol-disulfide isomerase/thioredoxin